MLRQGTSSVPKAVAVAEGGAQALGVVAAVLNTTTGDQSLVPASLAARTRKAYRELDSRALICSQALTLRLQYRVLHPAVVRTPKTANAASMTSHQPFNNEGDR